ncbi:MAG: hypothetical protein PHF67_02910 [Candidatus Nanoarchaeia archaeon]|nr:hypothetical protein [Candidatus Nanoarchaeia archaeon]
MFQSQKNVFWQALLITILIFSIGVIAGVILENWRTNQIDYAYSVSELNLLDVKLQSDIYSSANFDCKDAVQENIDFADKIYNEAKILERYETASKLTDKIIFEHKKYDLLRVTLLLNSIKIKDKCNASYHNIVYFYKFNNPGLDIKAKQEVFSNLLGEVKYKSGDEVLLIPISGDNNLTSVNLLMKKYKISEGSLPIILIDEKNKLNNLLTIEELEEYLK